MNKPIIMGPLAATFIASPTNHLYSQGNAASEESLGILGLVVRVGCREFDSLSSVHVTGKF
jgi:hypothetical protein